MIEHVVAPGGEKIGLRRKRGFQFQPYAHSVCFFAFTWISALVMRARVSQSLAGRILLFPMSTNRQSLVRAPRAISNFRATHSEKVLTCEINCGGAHGQTALWGSDLFFSRLDGLFSQNDLNCICGDVACLGLNRGICSFDLWVTVLMVLLRYSSDAREQLSGARWIGAVSFNRVR